MQVQSSEDTRVTAPPTLIGMYSPDTGTPWQGITPPTAPPTLLMCLDPDATPILEVAQNTPAGETSGGVAPTMADKCVGESLWGDPFHWRSILDMS